MSAISKSTPAPAAHLANGEPQAKIKLYGNHGCGWSHRVSIVLKELQLEHEEVYINMDEPRPEWFLKLNPVGLPHKYLPSNGSIC